jgi:hypothetical protein
MQYKVPQDVQREDTIIGPLTLKQLIILGAGGGLTYAIYITLAKTYFIEIWLPPVLIVGGITAAFAFLKIHSLPFHIFLMNFIEYHLLSRKRVWVQGTGTPFVPPFEEESMKKEEIKEIKQLKNQKTLKEISEVLDTHGESELSKAEKKEKLNEIINIKK